MITRLTLSNYRSLGEEVTLELGPLTALVGPNGAGKSSAGDALRFLSECLRDGLEMAVSRRNGIDSLIRWSGDAPLELGLTAHVENKRGKGSWAFVLEQAPGGVYCVKSESARWQPFNYNTSHTFSIEYGWWIQHPHSLKPAVERTALALPLVAGDSRFSELAQELKSVALYRILPDRLREPQKPNPARPMLEQGENWASTLKALDPAVWKPRVLTALSRIVGDIDDIRVSQLGGYLTVAFRHGAMDGRERWFDTSQESDGTLRLAGLLTALLQSPPMTLVGLEDPELTVHPGAVPVLYDFLRQASQHSQVLLTTHSPELLDLLGVNEVRVVERRDGVTRSAPLALEQREAVKRSLSTPGELMRAEGLRPERG